MEGSRLILDLETKALVTPVMDVADTLPMDDDGQSTTYAYGWSPDGNWILVGFRTYSAIYAPSIQPLVLDDLAAVPSDSVNAVVSRNDSELSPGVVRLRYFNDDQGGELWDISGEYALKWIP